VALVSRRRRLNTGPLYRLLLNTGGEIVYVAQASDLRIIEANRAAERAYGYTRAELLKLTPLDLRAPESRGLDFAVAMDKLDGGEARFDLIQRRKNGSTFPAENIARRMRVGGRDVYVNFVRDMTERERVRRSLIDAYEQALEASRARSNFVATISHEIRTPMNGVMGMTDVLLRTALSSEQRECAETIRESAEALLRIIDDVLDFSKIEAGRLQLESTIFEIRKTVSSVMSVLGPSTIAKGIDFTSSVDERVPKLVRGDPGRLRQVLLNIAGNAVKFTMFGGITVKVDIDSEDWVCFAVRDTGIGMSPEVRERLFRPFSQADASTTRRFGGSGLGLSISRRLIELMGGSLDLESTEGIGSCFTFKIPYETVDAADEHPADRMTLPPNFRFDARVLLAEDNAINQRVATKQLEQIGCVVTVVPTGRDAIARLRAEKYDVVLMDCHMPDVDGFMATRAIRAEEAFTGVHVPIIALTAAAMQQDQNACMEAGMDGYMTKPITTERLHGALARWLL
jgi:PAS domain S-box-containing protein